MSQLNNCQHLEKCYELLAPSADHHLELVVKVTHYTRYSFKKIYFPVGTYTPELVKEKIDQLALNDSFDNQYRVDYRIVNHQFIPVFKEQSLPPLKDGEKYQIEVLAGDDKFCYGYEYHLFSHALDAKGYEDFDNNILKFAQFMWGDRVIVLGVTVVKAEVETKKELALA